jgi:purine-binding chemotaxis protein CheW
MTTQSDQTRPAIGWDTLKERLLRAQAGLAAAGQLSPEQAQAVMDHRAQALARVSEAAPPAKEILEVMTARLAGERIAVETRFVREVYRPAGITPVPGSPQFLVGVTNLRGGILAVLDLRGFFGLPALPGGPPPQMIVVGRERPEFGLVVDEIGEVTKLRIGEVLEPPASVTGLSRDCLRGVTADALLVFDGDMLLSDHRLYVDEGGVS